MFTLNCAGRILQLDKPVVMGIINVTPDSFFAGSRQQTIDTILRQSEKMIKEGAVMLDIGGQSTRPGSARVSGEDELQRVLAPVEAITLAFPEVFLSIDTFYSRVAQEAVAAGACLVNDISAGSIDDKMISTVANLQVPYILMHMKGNPQTMHEFAEYSNIGIEVFDFFNNKIAAIKAAGIKDIIIDPGFGFSKTATHNFRVLRELNIFTHLNIPVLAGLSRKGTIYNTLGISAEQALNGTTVLNTVALMNGASILRVHDVREACEAVQLIAALRKA